MANGGNALLVSLMEHNVDANIIDFDHYRIRGGMAVETDYIICIKPKKEKDGIFDTFKVSKTYSAFRTLSSQLKKCVEATLTHGQDMSKVDREMVKFVQSIEHLIEAQKTRFLGKVNFNYVKSLSKQRAQILNDALETIVANFPKSIESGSASVRAISQILENFFLTDHVEDSSDDETSCSPSEKSSNAFNFNMLNPVTPLKKILKPKKGSVSESSDEYTPMRSITSPVVPITRKTRRSMILRAQDVEGLAKEGADATLLMDDDRSAPHLVPSYSAPVPTVAFAENNKFGSLIENSPMIFLAIFIASAAALKFASTASVTLDADIALLFAFAMFCLGLHMPRPSQSGIDTPPVVQKPAVSFAPPKIDRSGSFMLKRSLLVSPKATGMEGTDTLLTESEIMEGEEDPLIKSPLDMFPKGAKLGSHLNCWSMPPSANFHVRGPKYLEDKKKIPSSEYLFPARGVDLFLTDACPENVGSNSGVMGGNLRDKPTFIINFRLPWGVFIAYFEIPERFIPFVRKRYEFDFDGKVPDMKKMSGAERSAARFLEADQDTKNKLLKIVPVVVEGPWIVKSVVGGKPAIIGNKLPVNYIYQAKEGKKELYLEADLDIVSSSAARGILSVARSHTQVLTLDLGFVVQANEQDELPEQMLVGMRNHGIDPLTASPLPPMKNQFFGLDTESTMTLDAS